MPNTNNSSKNNGPDPELLKIINSQEMVDKTIEICEKNNIKEDKKQEILARFIRAVFWSLLPPKYFQPIIQSELGLDSEKAEQIYRDVDNLIFYPNRQALNKFYQGKSLKDILGEDLETTSEKPLKPAEQKEQKQEPEKEIEEKRPEEKQEKQTDTYREEI